jgi:hypothetical protein
MPSRLGLETPFASDKKPVAAQKEALSRSQRDSHTVSPDNCT